MSVYRNVNLYVLHTGTNLTNDFLLVIQFDEYFTLL